MTSMLRATVIATVVLLATVVTAEAFTTEYVFDTFKEAQVWSKEQGRLTALDSLIPYPPSQGWRMEQVSGVETKEVRIGVTGVPVRVRCTTLSIRMVQQGFNPTHWRRLMNICWEEANGGRVHITTGD